jgi:hypothetical protein
MAEIRRSLHQLLQGKQLYSSMYGVYTEALHDLAAVTTETAAKGETAKTTIPAQPSIEEFRAKKRKAKNYRRRRQNSQEAYSINHGSRRPAQLRSKPEVPPGTSPPR